MGICISVAEGVNDDNVTIFQARKVPNESQRLCSVYSQQGSKGLNQDAASVHEGYGMEDGTFFGVYDEHGGNGHKVSKIVSSRLSSLILDQKNVLEKIDAIENGIGCKKWKEAILSAFKVMDKEVKLQKNLDCSSSGTTAVGEGLVIANLGDSRAVLGTICDEKTHGHSIDHRFEAGITSKVWDVLSNNEVASIVWGVDSEEAVVEAATAAWNEKYPSYMADDCTVVCLILHKKSQLGA
uniref:PPM-type phosphatase domain-containing protein n=1 Tax=Glycine max TaxID=3847 RepID=A0A0R0GC01_SOYBN